MNSALITTLFILLIIFILIVSVSIILFSKYFYLKKIYLHNKATLKVLTEMSFSIKLKRVEALAKNGTSENEKQFSFLSINYKELLSRISKVEKLNNKFYKSIRSLKFKTAKKIENDILNLEIRDLTIEALDLTKRLDELTYTSTITSLVHQKITQVFNNFKNLYDNDKYSSSMTIQRKINELVKDIEEQFKDFMLNNQVNKIDDNLEILSRLAIKVATFGLMANKYPIIEGMINKFIVPKLKRINQRVKAYHYYFDEKREDISNYNKELENLISACRILIEKNSYENLFNLTVATLKKLFEFNFWSKLIISASNLLDDNISKISIDMNNIDLFNKSVVLKLNSNNYISEGRRDIFLTDLDDKYNSIKHYFKDYESNINISKTELKIDSQFSVLYDYFSNRDAYFKNFEKISEEINLKVKPLVTYKNAVSKLNNQILSINKLRTENNLKMDIVSENLYNRILDDVKYYLNTENKAVQDYSNIKVENALIELDDSLREVKEFLYLNLLLKGINNEILNTVRKFSLENNSAKKQIDDVSRYLKRGDYLASLETLLKVSKIYNLSE